VAWLLAARVDVVVFSLELRVPIGCVLVDPRLRALDSIPGGGLITAAKGEEGRGPPLARGCWRSDAVDRLPSAPPVDCLGKLAPCGCGGRQDAEIEGGLPAWRLLTPSPEVNAKCEVGRSIRALINQWIA
jgi:hypothetical protein